MSPTALAILFLVLLTLAAAGRWWRRRRVLGPAQVLEDAAHALAEGNAPAGAALSGVKGPLRPAALMLARAAGQAGVLAMRREGEAAGLRGILESLTEGVLAVDAARTVLLTNGRLKEMFDLRTPAVGRSLQETFRAPEVRAAVDAALRGEASARPITLDVRGADGRYVAKHFDLVAAPLAAAAAPGAVLVFHDVTALRRLETLRREFVANVSHELRTPLTLVRGHLETLREEGALDDRALVELSLGVMHKHALRLGALVDDLLTISRLEHGRGGLEPGRVPLAEAAARVIERLEPILREKGAACEVDIEPVGLAVRADPHRLDQVLFNLLDNALRHGVMGATPRVRVEARREGEFARLTVADNGPGIPASDQAHVWERFYRVHKDRSRDAGGTGLGLSIVKHIALAHGGRVGLESELGRGARFHVWLPAEGEAEVRGEE